MEKKLKVDMRMQLEKKSKEKYIKFSFITTYEIEGCHQTDDRQFIH